MPPNCTGTAPNYTNAPCLVVSNLAARAYRVTVWARTTRHSFSIARAAAGAITYPCTIPVAGSSRGGCRLPRDGDHRDLELKRKRLPGPAPRHRLAAQAPEPACRLLI